MKTLIGKKAPNLEISKWVQGEPTNIDQEHGHIVLVEVFQVNCPGCFLYAIPEAISIFASYKDRGVRILGIATAFEDFDKNTLGNLELLAETGEVIGETRKALSVQGQLLKGNTLPYKIPFPLAMDRITKANGEVSHTQVMQIIHDQVPNFDAQPETVRSQIIRQVKDYLGSKEYTAETFEKFTLRGTPSTILVDRNGILVDVSFGQSGCTKQMIEKLL